MNVSPLRVLGPLLALALLGEPLSSQGALLNAMSGTRGLVLNGKGGILGTPPLGPFFPVSGKLGASSAFADLNDDGYADLVVGAPALPTQPQSQNLDEAGRVYVIFGGPGKGMPGSSPSFDFAAYAVGQAVEFVGAPGDRLGSSVAALGDFDGDGIDDVAIGAPGHTGLGRPSAGCVYVLFGHADFDLLPKTVLLSTLISDPGNWAVLVHGARELALAGTSVSGDVDTNGDGRDDLVVGAPLDSTSGFSQNGTTTVLYGQPGYRSMSVIDLAGLAPGLGTVVHGAASFQFVGFSVAGIGRFDPVLPMTNNVQSPVLGDDVAIGAPGTTMGGAFFAGAAYVLRGVATGAHAGSYTTNDFGNGPLKAGVVYTGVAAGDQAGFSVQRVGNFFFDAQGFEDFAITAPYSDAAGKPDSGSIYVIPGSLLGVAPQGFSLAALGTPPTQTGIRIQGGSTAVGQQGVYVSNAGDWNGDSQPDLLVGFPNASRVSGTSVFVAAGAARILDGAALLATGGTASLGAESDAFTILRFTGEATGDHAGTGLAVGDFNGDGSADVSIGAMDAASTPDPVDFTGVARLETGRAHIVYGPLLRIESIAPAATHFGGPAVTVTASNVPSGDVGVTVGGSPATITQVVPGTPGSIVFQPPAVATPGQLVDLHLDTSAGDVTAPQALQYLPLAVTSGPNPPTGFESSTVEFTGQAFSTVADTSVQVQGFQATVLAVNGLAGTMTVQLPDGPSGNTPVDIVITNSNGSVTLSGVLTYLPVVVSTVVPAQGPQTSGVFFAGASPYSGQPAIPVDVTVETPGLGGPPPDTIVEFGTDALGYRQATITAINGDVITVDLPAFLLEAQTAVDVRVTIPSGNDVGALPGGFTYQASHFQELSLFQKTGLAPPAPRALMAGSFSNGGQILFLLQNLAGPLSQGGVLFVGPALANPPIPLHGGLFGISVATPVFNTILPGGFPFLAISQTMPTNMEASVDGLPLYLQVLMRESNGSITEWSHSNVLLMRIHSAP